MNNARLFQRILKTQTTAHARDCGQHLHKRVKSDKEICVLLEYATNKNVLNIASNK